MPKDENITTKIKLDISDLKANVSEMNRQIKLANSEFKASASSMDDWTKSTDGLSAKIKQLTSVQKSQESILSSLKEQYKMVVEAEGENSKSAQNLAIKINNQQSAINETSKKLKYYEDELGLLETAQKKAEKSGKSLEDELEDLKSATDKAGDSAKDSAGGWTVMKDVLADIVSNVIQNAIQGFKDLTFESENALDRLQASTGATDNEMKGFEDTLHGLYNNAYGESMDDLATKLSYVKQATGEIDPSKIGDLTKNAITLEDTFGSDFNETIRGVNNMMTHFGLSSEEAFDLFAKGSQVGLDYTSELGDNVAEYGGNFAQAGYSAEEYFQLLENGTKGGAYNLDKVNDSINEVKNRLGDGTIEKNIGMFSSGTQEAFKNWQEGKGTMKDVINSIVGDITNCTNEQDALTMSAIAFGTMGEDANLEVVKSLNTLGDTFSSVKGTMENVDTTRYDNLQTSLESLKRTLIDQILQPIVNTLAPPITDFINWVIENMNILAPIITGVAVAFGLLASAMAIAGIISGVSKAFAVLNAVMMANPIILIISLIAGLIAGLMSLWKNNEGFRDAVSGIWEGIKNVISTVVNAIVGFFKSAWEGIKTTFSAIGDFFGGIWDGVKNVFANVGSWFSDKFTKAKEGVVKAWSNIKDKFHEQNEAIKTVFSNVGSWFGEKFTNAKDMAVSAFSDIKDKFHERDEAIKSVFANVGSWFSEKFTSAKEGAVNAFSNIKEKFHERDEAIKSVFANVGSWFREKFTDAKEKMLSAFSNIKEKFTEILDKIKSVFGIESLRDAGKNLLMGLWNGINDKVAWLKSKVKGVVDKIKSWFTGKSGFDEHSPSKWSAKVGSYVMEGLDNGVSDYKGSGVKGMISTMKSGLEASIPANVGQVSPMSVGGSTTYNFNQTINSPKSLSRLEIYRQSKNLLSARGVNHVYIKNRKFER